MTKLKPSMGQMVHYVLPCCKEDHRFRPNAMGEHRPAFVINLRSDGLTVLTVLLDEHDAADHWLSGEAPLLIAVHADQDLIERAPGTWHFPEPDE